MKRNVMESMIELSLEFENRIEWNTSNGME